MNVQSKLSLAGFIAVVILLAAVGHTHILAYASIIAVIFIIFGINFFLSQRISERIEHLRSVINAVSKGNTDKRAEIKSWGETNHLAKDLNIMIENLMEARRLPENILRSMKDGLFVVDIEGNIRETNQAILEMLGYTKKELIGKPISAVFAKHTNL